MKQIATVINLALILMFICGCTSVSIDRVESDKLEITNYENSELGFSFDYPADWVVSYNTHNSVGIEIPNQDDTDMWNENIIISAQRDFKELFGKDMDLDEYTDFTIEKASASAEDYQIISSEDVLIAEYSAKKIIHVKKFKSELVQTDKKVKIMKVFFINKNVYYNIVFAFYEDNFDRYSQVMDLIVDSFRIIE